MKGIEPAKRDQNVDHQIFVGNIESTIMQEDIFGLFQRYGRVIDVVLLASKGERLNKGKIENMPGFGFVTFEKEEAVRRVLKAHREKPIELFGNVLNVRKKRQ